MKVGCIPCMLMCSACCCASPRLDLRDIKVVAKVGGTIDDSEMVDGMVFDQKVCIRGVCVSGVCIKA